MSRRNGIGDRVVGNRTIKNEGGIWTGGRRHKDNETKWLRDEKNICFSINIIEGKVTLITGLGHADTSRMRWIFSIYLILSAGLWP
jgi:hypothetical protein